MKKHQWRIQTRLLLTLAGLTTALLLVVVLAFNLSVRAYIQSRVSAQLDSIVLSTSDDRRGGKGGRGGRPFDAHPDRVIGTSGSAVALSSDGTLAALVHGEPSVGEELSAYFCSGHVLESGIKNKVITLDSGSYAISVVEDPVEPGQYLVLYVDVTSVTAFTARVNTVLAVIVLAAIALSILLSRRFAQSFAEPVQSLCGFAGEIGGGNFEQRTFAFRDAEFTLLADSMNKMARELAYAKQKQEVFFQNVSHELRTPLTSILGNAEGIVYGVMEPQAAGKAILSETDRLSGMVEDILYLSRMGKGAPEGGCTEIDLRDVLSLCVSEQRAEAEKRKVDFRFDFDDTPVMLAIREQDAQRLFGNLISNAIRYAEHAVSISCRADGEGVLAAVKDDGAGIAPEALPHIFERFYKGAGGKHGIGLSIVQTVAAAYHGSVSARNDGGAVFEVRFSVS